MRTFIAITLPENVKSAVAKIQMALKKERFHINWVKPENMHLTLKFLGDVKKEAIPGIIDAMKKSAENAASLKVRAKGIGAFPGFNRARVLWTGFTGETDEIAMLIEIHNLLENNLEQIGFQKEGRPFKAHLTIGRIRDPIDGRELLNAASKYVEYSSEPFIVDRMVLYKSDLKPGGPVYSKISEVIFDTIRRNS